MSHLAVWSPARLAPSWGNAWRALGHEFVLYDELGQALRAGADLVVLSAAELGDSPGATFRALGLERATTRVVVIDAQPVQVAALVSSTCTALAGPLPDGAICAALAELVLSSLDTAATWTIGAAQVHLGLREVHRDEQVFPLSEQETALLQVLWDADGQVVSRDVLYREVWDYRSRPRGRAVDFAVFRLRSKIESDPSAPQHLLTVRGAGFRLARAEAPVEEHSRAVVSLPAEPSTLHVGRRDELARIQQALSSGSRLVTIAGPGGAGKTRLSLRVAARELEGGVWPGGVGFVDLTDATSAAGAVRAVAESLGLSLAPGLDQDDAIAQIGAACLGRGRSLLIFDNCEQVVEPLRALVQTWLGLSPALVLLCTSRISLLLPTEVLVEVGALPDAQAAELLVERARAVRPGFSSAADDVHVLEVVRGLGGLPLAIELAASCLRLLSLGQIKARLDKQLDLLRGSSERPDRHATLRAALDWSWELLGVDDQRALAAVSVFCGSFELAAAAAVLADGDDLVAIERVAELVDHHLVTFDERTEPPQFALLPSVRVYGQERLAEWSELQERTRRCHAQWFAASGRDERRSHLLGERAPAAARRLGREFDNIVAAMDWAASHGEPDLAIDCLSGLEAYAYHVGGPVEYPLTASDAVLAMALTPTQRAAALRHRGVLFGLRQDYAAALQALDEALELQVGAERLVLADLHYHRGGVLRSLSRMDECRVSLEQAVALGQGASIGAYALQAVGFRELVLGQLDAAEATSRRALELARQLGEVRLQARLLASLSEMQRKQGRFAEAWQNNSAALEICERVGDERMHAGLLGNRGGIAWMTGQLDEAEGVLRESIRRIRQVGDRRNLAVVTVRLAWVLVFAGRDGPEVDSLGLGGVELARTIGNVLLHGVMRASWAELQLFRGAPEQSREVLIGASEPLASLGIPLVSFMSWCTWAGAAAQVGTREEVTEAIDTALSLRDQVQSPLTLALSLARLADAAVRAEDPRARQIWARLQPSARAMAGHPAVERLVEQVRARLVL